MTLGRVMFFLSAVLTALFIYEIATGNLHPLTFLGLAVALHAGWQSARLIEIEERVQ